MNADRKILLGFLDQPNLRKSAAKKVLQSKFKIPLVQAVGFGGE